MFRVVLSVACLVAVFAYRTHNVDNMEALRYRPVSQVQYNNCNTTAVPIYVRSLDLLPEPLQMGDHMTMSADLVFSDNINGMISYKMDVKLYNGTDWVEMCDDLPGFCSGDDVCESLVVRMVKCPDEVQQQGSNCLCPIAKKEYNFKNLQYMLPVIPGAWGLFNVTLQLNQNGSQLACVSTVTTVSSCFWAHKRIDRLWSEYSKRSVDIP